MLDLQSKHAFRWNLKSAACFYLFIAIPLNTFLVLQREKNKNMGYILFIILPKVKIWSLFTSTQILEQLFWSK